MRDNFFDPQSVIQKFAAAGMITVSRARPVNAYELRQIKAASKKADEKKNAVRSVLALAQNKTLVSLKS